MTKECQKVKHQLETRLLTVLYIQHPSNHSFKMSQNMIALNSWQREIQLAQEGGIEAWHQRKNYKPIWIRYTTSPNVLSHFKWHSVQAYACLHASWSMANFRTRSELCRTSISWWLQHAVQISVGCYSKDKFCSGQPYDFQETRFPYFPFNLDVGWGHGQRMPKNPSNHRMCRLSCSVWAFQTIYTPEN